MTHAARIMAVPQASVLVTPDSAGNVPSVGDQRAVFGACFYAEGPLPDDIETIEPFWHDDGVSLQASVRAARQAHALARSLQAELDGEEDKANLCLYLDLADLIIEIGTERMVRLSQFGGHLTQALPDRLFYEMPLPVGGADLKGLQKKQFFQWLCLRSLADADDVWSFKSDDLVRRVRGRFSSWRTSQRAAARAGTLYGANLRGYESLFAELGFGVNPLPNLVRRPALRRDPHARNKIAELIVAELSATANELHIPVKALSRYAKLWAAIFPETRVETRRQTQDAYRRWFDRQPVGGFITETGQARYDTNLFFASECLRRGIPTAVIQHGGLYGFDAMVPGYFVADLGWADFFFSWGWERFAGGYPESLQRARIVPMPNPKLSRLAARERWSATRPRTLLVPLSKFRTLDNRLGGNATDCHLQSSRAWVWDVVREVQHDFDKIIITHRSKNFESDLIARWLAREPIANVEIHHAGTAPASRLVDQVYAVLWDVSASGFLETLNAGVPTVARVPRGRWAVSWADDLMRAHYVAADSAVEAAATLRRLLDKPDIWTRTLAGIEPFLTSFGRASADYKEQWRAALAGCFGATSEATVL